MTMVERTSLSLSLRELAHVVFEMKETGRNSDIVEFSHLRSCRVEFVET